MGSTFRKRFNFFSKKGSLEAVARSEPGLKHCNGQVWG